MRGARTTWSLRASGALLVLLLTACGAPPTRAPAPPLTPTTDEPTEPDLEPAETDYEPRDLSPARLSDEMRARCLALDPLLQRVAREHGLDPTLVQAIIRIESGFRAEARSKVGARGLMQLMPRTARGLDCGDVWQPEANLRCGATLLVRYLARFEGNLIYALAAYNAGPARVREAYEQRRLPRNFRYVELVFKMRAFFQRGGCEAE